MLCGVRLQLRLQKRRLSREALARCRVVIALLLCCGGLQGRLSEQRHGHAVVLGRLTGLLRQRLGRSTPMPLRVVLEEQQGVPWEVGDESQVFRRVEARAAAVGMVLHDLRDPGEGAAGILALAVDHDVVQGDAQEHKVQGPFLLGPLALPLLIVAVFVCPSWVSLDPGGSPALHLHVLQNHVAEVMRLRAGGAVAEDHALDSRHVATLQEAEDAADKARGLLRLQQSANWAFGTNPAVQAHKHGVLAGCRQAQHALVLLDGGVLYVSRQQLDIRVHPEELPLLFL
mmetsp:Transcript_18671/g.56183  ORF Transcript_18671/g.56183 Transcript_18671/m.56183 type:complete len:286 (+) Transcript_18671:1371-2228(+)